MKILDIIKDKRVKKTQKELKKEFGDKDINFLAPWCAYKTVPLKESVYIIELSGKELQLVNFYLEIERRKPIMNVKIDVEKEKKK